MAVLTLRSAAVTPPFAGAVYTTKGAPLTYLEIDNNFIELDAEIHQNLTRIELVEIMLPVASAVAPTIPAAMPQGKLWYDTTNDDYLYWNGSQWISITSIRYIDQLLDVDTSTNAPNNWDLLRWDATATDADGNVGQWIPTNVIDGSPDGGVTDDF